MHEIPMETVGAATECIGRVLDTVHSSLSRLLTDDNLQLHVLAVARHHLAGKYEAAELQVQQLHFCIALQAEVNGMDNAMRVATHAASHIICANAACALMCTVDKAISYHRHVSHDAKPALAKLHEASLLPAAGCGRVLLPCI